jgi:transposase-like protein
MKEERRASVAGRRHGSRTRSLTGTFGPIEIAVPRARLTTSEGKTAEWKSQALRAYYSQRPLHLMGSKTRFTS